MNTFKPSRGLSAEELRADIKKLDGMIKVDRASRGVPEEAPDKFVPLAMTWALIDRCKPAEQFAVKYTQLCNKANEILPLTDGQTEWLRGFKDYLNLIRQSDDDEQLATYGTGLGTTLMAMLADEDHDSKADVFSYLKRLFGGLQIAGIIAESNRYTVPDPMDEDEFSEKYSELLAHYKSIKHLY